LWYVVGADWTGTDCVVDREGNIYKAGAVGDSTDRDATVDKFDSTATNYLAGEFIGATGTQETGEGVDLTLSSSTAPVLFAGNVSGGPITHYVATGPDATYNGGLDGFATKLTQPLSP
jgi:hypothetical protein